MTVQILQPLPFPWQETRHGEAVLYWAGRLAQPSAIAQAATDGDSDSLCALLLAERGSFGLILQLPGRIYAATDRVRGFPVFLRQTGLSVEITPDSRPWIATAAGDFSEDRVEPFLTSGYVLGEDTFCASIRRLLPGSLVEIDLQTSAVSLRRYYAFSPDFSKTGKAPAALEAELDAALNAAFDRTIAMADAATIWVPLSAGYDSRLVLAKLLERGQRRIETFSYGMPGNMEARVAREIAAQAGVPWRFVSSLPEDPRAAFATDETSQYILLAGGLSNAPALTEYFALRSLKLAGVVGPDDVFVNGQTGDYLSGGHIPKTAGDFASVAAYCLNKHFSLFGSLRSRIGPHNIAELLAGWQARYLPASPPGLDTRSAALSLYQSFEWQERQAGYVVQQQRAYDVFGFRWSLPLWDADLMDFYTAAPLDEQIQQAVYLRHLRKWNYRGLFNEGRRPYNPWPRHRALIQLAGRMAGLVGGEAAKKAAYRQLYYWSDQHTLYALFGRRSYTAFAADTRNPVSFIALELLYRLRRAMGVAPQSVLERAYAATRL